MENEEMIEVNEQKALAELEKGYENAKVVLEDKDKLEELFQRIEKKLKVIPKVGEKLAVAASIASLVKSYINKEYTKVPIGTIIAAISALVYFVSPIDLVPDAIPGAGHIDDIAVIAACLKLIETDLAEYIKWRKENGKELDA